MFVAGLGEELVEKAGQERTSRAKEVKPQNVFVILQCQLCHCCDTAHGASAGADAAKAEGAIENEDFEQDLVEMKVYIVDLEKRVEVLEEQVHGFDFKEERITYNSAEVLEEDPRGDKDFKEEPVTHCRIKHCTEEPTSDKDVNEGFKSEPLTGSSVEHCQGDPEGEAEPDQGQLEAERAQGQSERDQGDLGDP